MKARPGNEGRRVADVVGVVGSFLDLVPVEHRDARHVADEQGHEQRPEEAQPSPIHRHGDQVGGKGRRLLEANLNNDEGILEEVAGLLRELKEAWDAIADQV